MAEDNFQRGLIWEAGWAQADAPSLTLQDVLGMVSWNIAHMYGLNQGVAQIVPSTRANFVLYSGTPGQLSSHLLMIVDGSQTVCNPSQV